MTLTIAVVCYVLSTWKPPADWRVLEVTNREACVAVRLEKTVEQGATVAMPTGCEPEPPKIGTQQYYFTPNGSLYPRR